MGIQTSIFLWVSYPVQLVAAMKIVLFPYSYTHFVGTHLNTLLLVPIVLMSICPLDASIAHLLVVKVLCMCIIGQHLLSK